MLSPRMSIILSGPDSTTIRTTTTEKATIPITTSATIKTSTTMFNPNQTLLYTDHLFNYYKVKVAPGTFMRTGTSSLTCAKYGMRAVCGGTPYCYAKGGYQSQCVNTPLSHSSDVCFAPL